MRKSRTEKDEEYECKILFIFKNKIDNYRKPLLTLLSYRFPSEVFEGYFDIREDDKDEALGSANEIGFENHNGLIGNDRNQEHCKSMSE